MGVNKAERNEYVATYAHNLAGAIGDMLLDKAAERVVAKLGTEVYSPEELASAFMVEVEHMRRCRNQLVAALELVEERIK